MNKGRRQKLKGGREWDVISGWRHIVLWCKRAGKKAQVKRKMNRRWRRELNAKTKDRD